MIISTPFCFPHVCPSLDNLQLPLQYLHVLLYAILNTNICNIGERKLTLHQLGLSLMLVYEQTFEAENRKLKVESRKGNYTSLSTICM